MNADPEHDADFYEFDLKTVTEYRKKKLELEPENEETLWELFESAVTHVCIGKGGEISLSQKDQKECAS